MSRLTIGGALLTAACLLPLVAHAQAKASADIKDTSGRSLGEAILVQQDGAVEITATLTGLPPGDHAFHIHEVGRCDPPFESAGGHFNPQGRQHGKDNPAGPHAGDMPDRGPNALLDQDGASLVVHERGDDYKTDPAGHAGRRIACGVIRR